jgi:hypothetical protein
MYGTGGRQGSKPASTADYDRLMRPSQREEGPVAPASRRLSRGRLALVLSPRHNRKGPITRAFFMNTLRTY